MMVHASLFSGIGGPEVAAAMLGWKNAFHCEINPFGKGVLDYWFPNSESYEDITKTDFTKWYGRIDVLTGGFPCQPFSYAGKRGGREDERYLWPEMLRVIQEVRPTWVVGENVAGITTMVEGGVLTDLGCEETLFNEGDALHRFRLEQSFTIERICKDFEAIGYEVQPMLIPAAACGAPHRRDRVFFLAYAAHSSCGGHTSYDQGGRIDEGRNDDELSRKRGFSAEWVDGLPAFQGDASNSQIQLRDGCCIGYEGESGRNPVPQPGDSGREETIADTYCDRGDKVYQHLQSQFPNGVKPFCDGWKRDAPYTDCQRFQKSKPSGGRPDSEETGTGIHDRTQRPCTNGYVTHTEVEQYDRSQSCKSENCRQGKWTVGRSDRSGIAGRFSTDSQRSLLPENKWRYDENGDWIPTFSPVHRGNDGIPIRLDDLTISFSRWRTESLKAYGNAIVPQVMYRIFQAIEQTQQ